MPDNWTSTTTATGLVLTAYNMLAEPNLRAELYFDGLADVQPTRQNNKGASVVFTRYNELAAATTPLVETADIDAQNLTTTPLTVTLQEYGNAMITTAKLRATGAIEVDPIVADLLGFNAGLSQDQIVSNVLTGGTNVAYAGDATSRITVDNADKLTSAIIRRQLAALRTANVPTRGGAYMAFIHPNVSFDLRGETGAAAWRDPHVYSEPGAIWNGEIGMYEGFRFVEAPRAPVFAGAGAAGINVYGTLFAGARALAKIYSTDEGGGPQPRIVQSPVIDKLRRFQAMGWYWMGGYGIYEQAALRRVESGSGV
jgi:N4-gp56 family major capsid protein